LPSYAMCRLRRTKNIQMYECTNTIAQTDFGRRRQYVLGAASRAVQSRARTCQIQVVLHVRELIQ